MRIPLASQSGSCCRNSLFFDQLNVSRADIACVFKNDVGKAVRSTQQVTLYITINITTPPIHISPLLHRQPVETGNAVPQSRKETPPLEGFLFSLDRADEAMKLIGPINRSTKWESAVERINWLMDALSPVADVRVLIMCFSCPQLG